MTDIEMTKLCAQAMGIEQPMYAELQPFNPLDDDAQAMALVKTFRLVILADHADNDNKWSVSYNWQYPGIIHEDLNRAIVTCVAKMQSDANE